MARGKFRWSRMRRIKIMNRNDEKGFILNQSQDKRTGSGFRPMTSGPLGFTIIELLLAATIMSMISLAVVSTFGAGLRVFDRVQSFGGFQADVLVFLEGLEHDLRNIFAFSPIKFQGDSRSMSFASVGTKLDEDGNEFTVLEERSYDFDGSQKGVHKQRRRFCPNGFLCH